MNNQTTTPVTAPAQSTGTPVQNLDCIQSISHFASNEYVNICNGSRLAVPKSGYMLTGQVALIVLAVIVLAAVARMTVSLFRD